MPDEQPKDGPAGQISSANIDEVLKDQAEPLALQTYIDAMSDVDKKLAVGAATKVFELSGRLDKKPQTNIQNNFNLSKESFDRITEGARGVLTKLKQAKEIQDGTDEPA